jgi:fatty acyl-ACP thioesterase A
VDIPTGKAMSQDALDRYRDKRRLHRDVAVEAGRPPLLLGYREFRLRDGTNLFVGVASSSWALFDVHARQVATPPTWLEEAVRWDSEQAAGFERATVPRLTMVDYERSVIPRVSDLDINGHVNNAQLLGWTLEALPREVSAKQNLREIDVQFRHECRLDDQVASRAEAKNADIFHHSVIRVDDGHELVRARSLDGESPCRQALS